MDQVLRERLIGGGCGVLLVVVAVVPYQLGVLRGIKSEQENARVRVSSQRPTVPVTSNLADSRTSFTILMQESEQTRVQVGSFTGVLPSVGDFLTVLVRGKEGEADEQTDYKVIKIEHFLEKRWFGYQAEHVGSSYVVWVELFQNPVSEAQEQSGAN